MKSELELGIIFWAGLSMKSYPVRVYQETAGVVPVRSAI